MSHLEIIQSKQQALVAAAFEAQANAYCPISHFPVGAAVLTTKGEIYAGCNVENAALPCGWCAEVSAVAAAVSNGHRRFIAYAVTADTEETISPCGRCRQVMAEFASPGAPVFMRNKKGLVRETELSALLPMSFSLQNLPAHEL
ncbi:cytidine deaminase [Clonorchis sinensis]|uniref:Cytidine deaminase n=1 Tax=Clonorchis sinensis TaxID=79923 RepID=G7YN75_CLOSI|nr:cytidine deaminase [Clonorchis sinensis]